MDPGKRGQFSFASAVASIVLALLTVAPGCAGKVSPGTDTEARTSTVSQNLGLGLTATPLELEVLTSLCTATGRQDVFRLTNRGTTPVKLSDVSFKYWADDTSGQTLVPTLQSGGILTSATGNLGCVHQVSGATASATSFSPACGPDATHQANWELAIANRDGSTLAPGAAWSDIRVDLALADGSSFSPGTADWYSPCLAGTSFANDLHFGVYDQGNSVTVNGVITAPSCRPPTLACLVEGTYAIPVTGNACVFNIFPVCAQTNTPLTGVVGIGVAFDPTRGWIAYGVPVLGAPFVLNFPGTPIVQSGSTFTATALPSFCEEFQPCTSFGFAVDCATGEASVTETSFTQSLTGCPEGGKGCGGPGGVARTNLSGRAILFSPSTPGATDAGGDGGAAVPDAGNACPIGETPPIASASPTPVPILGLPGAAAAVAAGNSHVCTLMADGSVACWGDNSVGQLGIGNGILSLSSTPIAVSGLNGVRAIAAGGNSTCALLAEGTVACWGSSGAVSSATPAPVPVLSGATAITVSTTHACALLAGGTVWCWGQDTYGELGDGATSSTLTPVAVSGLSGVVAVSAGNGSTCALLSDGTTDCWGRNDSGQLGNGSAPSTIATPTPVATPVAVVQGAKELAASPTGGFTCVSGGSVACWGRNGSGQLGDGTTSGSSTPVAVSGACGVASVSAGDGHACAIVDAGGVQCWGDNSSGELGDGTTSSSSIPVGVAGLAGAKAIATGVRFTCALLGSGEVDCWGDNGSGQLGIGQPVVGSDAGSAAGPAGPPACQGGTLEIVTATSSSIPVEKPALHGAAAIAVGFDDTCALRPDGTVECSGYNASGQLGNGTQIDATTPVLVSGVSGATAIRSASDHTCVLLAGGSVKCWGANSSGQLGNGTNTDSTTPVVVGGLGVAATAIAAAAGHTCALLTDHTVECWGDNTYGQLGNGTTTSSTTPVPVSGLRRVAAISAGLGYNCALLAGGTAACWGNNAYGALGSATACGSTTLFAMTPVPVSGLTGATAIAAGTYSACALLSGGSVRCWGDNSFGELGNGTTVTSSTPVAVSDLDDVMAIAAGGLFQCVLLSGGAVRCWGDNGVGELGNGTKTGSSTPVAVSGVTGATTLVAGAYEACARLSDGAVKCWGYLGDDGGPFPPPPPPPQLPLPPPFCVSPIAIPGLRGASLTAGFDDTCALLADRTVACFGFNGNGQLGNGTTTSSATPVAVSGLSQVTAVAGGASFNCALVSGGTVQCWGANSSGQLGNGGTADSSTPVVVSGLGAAIAVAAGSAHACALLSTGTVACWGDNTFGNLGDGTTTSSATPVSVLAVSGATAIAVSQSFSCALLAHGKVRCWGDNSFGEIGTGATTGQLCAGTACWTTPAEVTDLHEARAVSTGFDDTCALQSNGAVECWGDNTYGQLGNGTSTTSTSPVLVSDLRGVTSIAAGGAFHCALLSNGRVKCWGDNTYGELGNGTTTSSTTPVAVSNLSGVTSISAGAYRACARLSDARVQCWGYLADDGGPFPPLAPPPPPVQVPNSVTPLPVGGFREVVRLAAGAGYTCALQASGQVACLGNNSSGQLGSGSALDSSAPIAVPALEGVVEIAAGEVSACARLRDGTVRCWGDNTFGELGNGTMVSAPTPVPVTGLSAVIGITVGNAYACALRKDGGVACWGDNSFGELGNATTNGPDTCGGSPCSTTPVSVSGLLGVKALFAGNGARENTCALLAGGTLSCWGDDRFGALGNGAQAGTATCFNGGACSTTPVAVPGLSGVRAIAAGGFFNCALLRSGTVNCWGDDSQGELGDNTTNSTTTPLPVPGLSGVEQIATGELSACALLSNGQVECWGYNGDGELGNGSTTSPSPPGLVPGLSRAKAVAAGDLHTCALIGGSELDCWGDNTHGQLGNDPMSGAFVQPPLPSPFIQPPPPPGCGTACPPGSTCQYEVADEGQVCAVSCAQGTIGSISVVYADNCNATPCPAAASACPGLASCSVTVSNAICGTDPCLGTPKSASIAIGCTP
jgi:alpha-tubulin suppressor-like RCC1 family protein